MTGLKIWERKDMIFESEQPLLIVFHWMIAVRYHLLISSCGFVICWHCARRSLKRACIFRHLRVIPEGSFILLQKLWKQWFSDNNNNCLIIQIIIAILNEENCLVHHFNWYMVCYLHNNMIYTWNVWVAPWWTFDLSGVFSLHLPYKIMWI